MIREGESLANAGSALEPQLSNIELLRDVLVRQRDNLHIYDRLMLDDCVSEIDDLNANPDTISQEAIDSIYARLREIETPENPTGQEARPAEEPENVAADLAAARREIARVEQQSKSHLTEDEKAVIYAKYLGERANALDQHTADLYAQYGRITRSSKLKNALATIGRVTGFSALGVGLRNLMPALGLGAFGGMITGGVVGGIAGGWRGRERARNIAFGADAWIQQYQAIKNERHDPNAKVNAMAFLEQVLGSRKNYSGNHRDLLKLLGFYRTEAARYMIEDRKTHEPESINPVTEAVVVGGQRMAIDNATIEQYIESWDNIDQQQIIRDYKASQRGRICKGALLGGLKGAAIGAGIGGIFDLVNLTLHHAQTPPPHPAQNTLSPDEAYRHGYDRVIVAHDNDYGIQYHYTNEYTPTHIHPSAIETSHGLTQSTDYGDALRYAVEQGVKSGQLQIPSALQNHNLIHELHFAGGPNLPLGADYHFDQRLLQDYLDHLAAHSSDSSSYYSLIRHASGEMVNINHAINNDIIREAHQAGLANFQQQVEHLADLRIVPTPAVPTEIVSGTLAGGAIGALSTVAGREAASSPFVKSAKSSVSPSGSTAKPETQPSSAVKPPLSPEAKRTAQAEEAKRKEAAKRYQSFKAIATARFEDKNFEANDTPENRRKLAWFDVYSRLDVNKPEDQALHDRVDRLRQQWAAADDVSGDYPQDDSRFRYQTGQAMLEIIAGDENFHLPYAEAAQEMPMDEKVQRTRAFARFVLNYISNYDELAGEKEESDTNFKRLAREAINQRGLAVHSQGDKGSDLDGETAIHLFDLIPQEAGMPNVLRDVKYIPTGTAEKDRINIDTGNRDGFVIDDGVVYLDHHTPGTQRLSSATEMTYLFLRELGLIEDKHWIRSLVRFVTDVDSGNIDHAKLEPMFNQPEYSYSRSLLALSHTATFAQLCDFFQSHTDATILTELTEKEITQYFGRAGQEQSRSMNDSMAKGEQVFEKLKTQGFIVETKYGNALIDVRHDDLNPESGDARWPTELGYVGAAAKGCPVYVIWTPGSSYFVSFNLPDSSQLIDFNLGADCLDVRGHLFMKRKDQKLQTTLTDILEQLDVGTAEIKPALKKVIEYQPKPPSADNRGSQKKKGPKKKPPEGRSEDGSKDQ